MEERLERYRADRKKLMKMNRLLYTNLQYFYGMLKRSVEEVDKMAEECGALFSTSDDDDDEEGEEEAESESDDEEASFSSSDGETKKRKRGEEEGEEEGEDEDDDSSSSSSSQCSLSKLHQDSSDGE